MLDRITTREGVVFYRSPLLARIGVPHGFSTRIGGISAPPFDSMNLGNPNGCAVQDPSENVAKNYDRLHAAIGCVGRHRVFVHQVHGDVVAIARRGSAFNCNAKADAIVSDDPERVASVRVADCVPVLLSTADGKVVAAVHAGWRGVVAGVVLRAADQIAAIAGKTEIVAAIGAGISADVFEIGPEVVTAFKATFGRDAETLLQTSRNAGKSLVDLQKALLLQLASIGVPDDQIDTTDRCTYRDREEFFSHRRENGVTGRMAALVGVTA